MSFSREQAFSFLEPLKGKTSTFIVEGRRTNLSFAQSVASLLALTDDGCTILDLDAFYSSNSDQILSRLPAEAALSIRVRVPEPGSSIETEFPGLFGTGSGVIIIDSLNTLYHLFSFTDGSLRGRKLAFAIAGLSYLARIDRRAVLSTMYRRERPVRTGRGRPISNLSDLTIHAEADGSELRLRCVRGTAWPRSRFSIRTP